MNEWLQRLRPYLGNSDVVLGAGVIVILTVIIVPLPGTLLDGLLVISLLLGMLVLMTALASNSPADFTVFPTILLVTTLFRLAVNVATTRMILTQGAASSSKLIEAFGTFVVGGSEGAAGYVVGVIIFLIITLVQIMVITKGATRVSEVAARFTLDSMPGKQLAIDSDVNAGYIDEKEARRRRQALQKEMEFYGSMDGASKFVQGDVRVGLIITGINIMGGMLVGMLFQGSDFTTALETYTRFTIGDGLASSIPALLITTATGIIVTRAAGNDSLPEDMRNQMFANSKVLYVVGGVLIAGGLIPGFPLIAMALIGGGLIFLGRRIETAQDRKEEDQRQQDRERPEERKPESYLEHLRTEALEVEIGYNLIPLVDPKSGGTLLDQISRLRRRFAMESGLIVPPVRIRDNMNLQPGQYVVKLHGSVIGSFTLEPDRVMAIDTGRVTMPLRDVKSFEEPTYGMTAYWVAPEQKNEAESGGYDVVDPSTVIATHLSSIIQQNASEIMGRQEVKNIVDSIREENAVIVDEVLTEKKVSLGQIQAVLQGLLKEGVSIRNMVRVLETIANNAERTHGDPYLLTEAVRQALRRQIVGELVDEENVLHCVTLEPGIDRRLREGIHRDEEEGFVMALKPDFQVALRDAIQESYQQARDKGKHPVFLCSRAIRAGIFSILERLVPSRNFAVLAHEEIPTDVRVNPIGQVSLRRQEEEVAAP